MISILPHQVKIAWYKPLRQIMFKKKLTVSGVAEKAGIGKQTLVNIMNGNVGVRLTTLFCLLDALEMNLWLIDKDGQSWRLKP